MKKNSLLLLFLLFSVLCVQGQGIQKILPAAQKATLKASLVAYPSAVRAAMTAAQQLPKTSYCINKALLQKIHQARLQAHTKTAEQLEAIGFNTTVRAYDPFLLQETVSAFVFKYEGQVWGATARHVALGLGPRFHLLVSSVGDFSFPVEVAYMGTEARLDAAIFKIPPQMAGLLSPVKLANRPMAPLEQASSYGYGEEFFAAIPGRQVQSRVDYTLQTQFDFQLNHRRGLCGSVLLNPQGEAVGMHVGSSKERPVGYAITAQGLKDLVHAANGETPLSPILFKGTVIGQLAVDEHITHLYLYKQKELIHFVEVRRHFPQINPAKLEELFKNMEGDVLTVRIQKENNFIHGKKVPSKRTKLTYDLKTGQVLHAPSQTNPEATLP